jgi:tRNA(His) 5'-end guanylyltransferase
MSCKSVISFILFSQGTQSANKNEMLFKLFEVNYNAEPAMYRKGSVIVRDDDAEDGNKLKVRIRHFSQVVDALV